MSESFYLSQLDVAVTSSSATLSGSSSVSFDGSANVSVSIPLATFKSLFQYHTDSADVTDASNVDVLFRTVYSTSASPLGLDIDTSALVGTGAIDTSAISSVNHVTHDYVRYLAQMLFNTHLGVDLFNNEEALRSSLNASFKTQLNTVLLDLNDDGVTDQEGTSPSRTIFNQLIANQPSRFNDIVAYQSEVVNDKQWYYMPGIVGDKFYFLLRVSSASDQQKLTAPSSTTQIGDRTYLICANIVA